MARVFFYAQREMGFETRSVSGGLIGGMLKHRLSMFARPLEHEHAQAMLEHATQDWAF